MRLSFAKFWSRSFGHFVATQDVPPPSKEVESQITHFIGRQAHMKTIIKKISHEDISHNITNYQECTMSLERFGISFSPPYLYMFVYFLDFISTFVWIYYNIYIIGSTQIFTWLQIMTFPCLNDHFSLKLLEEPTDIISNPGSTQEFQEIYLYKEVRD